MNTLCKLLAASAALSLSVLGGCATGNVSSSERDTNGTYDGVWIGSVAKPRSSTEILPGNWTMSCKWEPYDIYLVVDDGRVQLGKREQKSFVSTKGTFKIKLSSGAAGMTGGVMQGNGQFVQVFSGTLSGDSPQGKYLQFVSSIGGNGCNSKIHFRRYVEDA